MKMHINLKPQKPEPEYTWGHVLKFGLGLFIGWLVVVGIVVGAITALGYFLGLGWGWAQ